MSQHQRQVSEPDELDHLLDAMGRGDTAACDRVFAIVYDELHGLSHARMGRERDDHTWSTTDLVHEVAQRLLGSSTLRNVNTRRAFFGLVAKVMEHALIDHARDRAAQKRGSNATRTPLDPLLDQLTARGINPESLSAALASLREHDEECHGCLTMWFYAGRSQSQIAELYGVSEATVRNRINGAKVYLRQALEGLPEALS